jgi:hypothetical protein
MPADRQNPTLTTLALRKISHKYAAEIAHRAKRVHRAAEKLLRTQRRMEREARRVAGKDYKNEHGAVGFDTETLYKQNNRGDIPTDPAITDIVTTVSTMEREASRVAAEAVPPPLSWE